MSTTLSKASAISAVCAVLLLSACGSQGNTEASTAEASPTVSSAAASPVASSAPATSASPSAQETSPAPSPTAEASSEQASPTPEQPTPEPTQAAEPLAQAGTNCGPSNTGRTTLVLAEGAASCAEVQQVFADFNAQFTGSTDPVNINGYTCNSYSEFATTFMGRTVTCEGKGNRLEAMTDYRLGGIPIGDPLPYSLTSLTGHFSITAQAHGVSCSFGEGNHFICVTPSGGNTNLTIRFDENGSIVQNTTKESTVVTDVEPLPTGYSINTATASCLNDGTYLVCSNGTSTFRFNATEFTEL